MAAAWSACCATRMPLARTTAEVERHAAIARAHLAPLPDGDAKDARCGAARHAIRAGYAMFACCAAWAACSAMGADFGIVNGATGQGAATLAAFIIAAAIAKKSVGRK